MKIAMTLLLTLMLTISFGQSLPIDFESDVLTSDFVDFDGGTATVIDNPQMIGINTSNKVAQIKRDGGQIWAGSKIELTENLDFSTFNSITMKVFTSAPIGTIVKFKLEGEGSTERDVPTTVSNEWETMTWDFTGTPAIYNSVVFMFDFGNVGNGSENSTFLFDDIIQLFGGIQIDLPVNFENNSINYSMTDFGGNHSSYETDPEDSNNHVIKVIKTDQAATWAGTTIGTQAGFATDIPLLLTDSKMTVRVWSPEAGTPIRLKVEDSNDPTHTCETETLSTQDGAWEYMEFDFNNQAPGTESLSVGLSMGWTYNKASIFFNFGTEGATVGTKTYYFDNVSFGEFAVANKKIYLHDVRVTPNPSSNFWSIQSGEEKIQSILLFDQTGKNILSLVPTNSQVKIDASELASGLYIARLKFQNELRSIKLVKH